MGTPVKRGNWGDWATIQPKPNEKRITCYWCAFCQEDGSCEKHPVVIAEIGSNYWKTCKYFRLDKAHESQETLDVLLRIRPDYLEEQSETKIYNRDHRMNELISLPTHIIGKLVKHKTLGNGRIIAVDKNKLDISFTCGTKRFIYPDAFATFLDADDELLRMIVAADLRRR